MIAAGLLWLPAGIALGRLRIAATWRTFNIVLGLAMAAVVFGALPWRIRARSRLSR